MIRNVACRVVSAAVLLAPILVQPAAAATVPCQRAIAQESDKLLRTEVKALQKCEDRKVKGKLPAGTECNAEPKIEAKIEAARSKLRAKIDRACGGVDRQCGGDTTGEDGGTALGWPPSCPDYDDTPDPQCVLSIGAADCGGIADCLVCIAGDVADQAMQEAYGALVPSDPRLDARLNKCQQAVGKESAKFLLKKAATLRSCWDRRLKGQHGDDCPDTGTTTKIAKAESKMLAKICKACGGTDKACGGGDDFDAAEIGFENDCADVTVPFGGPSCKQDPVTTLTELAACVDCLTEYRVDCLDRARVPQFGAFPAECTPVAP